MSTIKVNTIETRTGSTLTLGKSGDTVSIASGASTSGMGRTGTVDWQTSIKTESFTAVNGEGYFIDTTDGSPFKNYAVTVASGTLYVVGGTGNIFNLDGSRQLAITLIKGKTYRFTQSDATNDGHPLVISTSNSSTLGTFQAGIVSSGVTYYLDGSSNQSNYTNTSNFNGATTRYVEFQPQATGTYYYGCYVHGIGMGGAITAENLTVSLPSASVGNIVSISDYSRNFNTESCVIKPNGTDKIGGFNANSSLTTQGKSITLIYADTTQGWTNVQDSNPVKGNPFLIATGGTKTTSGNCTIHTFTSPGTFTVNTAAVCSANNQVSYMVVAGGGGGASGSGGEGGGGGGAGGFREDKSPITPFTASPLEGAGTITVSATGYPITIGGGGAGGTYQNPHNANERGVSGSASIFSSITSAGGGGGGPGNNPSVEPGIAGASGGGGGSYSNTAGAGNTPPVSPPQGSAGGNGGPGSPGYASGGGGGATAVGGAGGPSTAGAGGAGATTNINGSPTAFSGGGGGGAHPAGTGGAGGTGGGGAGSQTGSAGSANTGGGGGGSGNTNSGASGGSGIVIIRYKSG